MRRSPPLAGEWTCVDLGARAVRWLELSSGEPPEGRAAPLEAPTLSFLGPEPSFVQEAARLGERAPEWLCRDLVTLLSEPRGPRPLGAPPLAGGVPRYPYPSSPRSATCSPSAGAVLLRTAAGPRAPEAALAELVAELLSPSRLLGGVEAPPAPRSIAWLSSPGHAPGARLTLARLFEDLGARRVAPLNAHAALAWGLSELIERRALVSLKRPAGARLWATLDVGESQASLCLVRVDEGARRLEVLAQHGRPQVGTRAIEGRLLDERLSKAGLAWEDLAPGAAAHIDREVQERLYSCLARYLPRHVTHSPASLPPPAEEDARVVAGALDDLAALARGWLARSLAHIGAPLEALDALWLTGSGALALLSLLRRELPMVQVRVAPPHVALGGAARLVAALDSAEGPVDLREAAGESVLVAAPPALGEEGAEGAPPPPPPVAVARPGDPLPAWRAAPLDPSAPLSSLAALQLCVGAEGERPLWLPLPPPPATSPLTGERPRALEVSYESPSSFSARWR